MPGFDYRIGNDGDYIDDGAGAFELTLTAQPALRHAILDRLGEWIGDSDAGREVRGVRGRRSSEAELEAERDTVLKALAPLGADGLIDDITVEVDRDATGRFALFVRCRDTQSGGTIDFDNLQSFGG